MPIRRPKSFREGYAPPAFFYSETTDHGDVRLVAWTAAVDAQAGALVALLMKLPSTVEVTLQVAPLRYHGVVSRGALIEALGRCARLIYSDGRTQLCVRHPVTLEYVVFDEFGVFYVYSKDQAFRATLQRLGFAERQTPLISECGGQRRRLPGSTELEAEFVRLLRLTPIPAPGHSHAARLVH